MLHLAWGTQQFTPACEIRKNKFPGLKGLKDELFLLQILKTALIPNNIKKYSSFVQSLNTILIYLKMFLFF